jgi:peroxiredoxin
MKRVFISAYVAFLIIGFFWFVFQVFNENVLAYWGAVVSAFGGVIYFSAIYTFYKVPRTPKNLWAFGSIVYLGLIMVLASLYSNPIPAHYTALGYAALNIFFWDRYVNWYSSYSENENVLEEGVKMPSGSLQDSANQTHSIDQFLTKKAVWVFYRGNWCPFCMAQVEEMVNHYKEISDMAADVIFIGSQSEEKNSALSKKFNIEAKFLTDLNHQYGKSIGLLDEGGLPLGLEVLGYERDVYRPAVLVTDEKGIVRYLDISDNYRLRPEPQEFLTILKGL